MKFNLLELLTAALGTMGFSLVFNIKRDKIPYVGLGGFIAWTIYLIVYNRLNSIFLSNILSTFIICLYSEFCARKLKAPANIFLVPSIFPLIPGGALYYTMNSLVKGVSTDLILHGTRTVHGILGIVVGMILGTSFFYVVILNIKKYLKK